LNDRPPDAFAAMATRTAAFFKGQGPPLMEATTGRQVLVALLTALEAHESGMPLDVDGGLNGSNRPES
jgi:hypothetical protein